MDEENINDDLKMRRGRKEDVDGELAKFV